MILTVDHLTCTNQFNNMFTKEGSLNLHFFFLFKCYLAATQLTLGHYRGGSLTYLMLITAFLHIWPWGHLELRNKVNSLCPAEHTMGFELGTFRFWQQRCPWWLDWWLIKPKTRLRNLLSLLLKKMLKPSKHIPQLKLIWMFVISTFLGMLTIVTKNIFRKLLPPISHMNK